ncbi:MAG: hypothetical protein D6818_03635, partial [Bacteroidetes bacterium]
IAVSGHFEPGVPLVVQNANATLDGGGTATLKVPAGTEYQLQLNAGWTGFSSAVNEGLLRLIGHTTIENDVENRHRLQWESGNIVSANSSVITNRDTLLVSTINNFTVGVRFVNEPGGLLWRIGGPNGNQTIPTAFENKDGAEVRIEPQMGLIFNGTLTNSGTMTINGGLTFRDATAQFSGDTLSGTGAVYLYGGIAVSGHFEPGVPLVVQNANTTLDGGGTATLKVPAGTEYQMQLFAGWTGFSSAVNEGLLRLIGHTTIENDVENLHRLQLESGNIVSANSSVITNRDTLLVSTNNNSTVGVRFVNEPGGLLWRIGGPNGTQTIPTAFDNKDGAEV